MANTILRTIFVLVGLFVFATGSSLAIQSYEGPVLKESLIFVAGTLTNVTECSNGRRRVFFYTVTNPTGQKIFKDSGCPNEQYDTMRMSMGVSVEVGYHDTRGFLFSGKPDIYELTVSGRSFSTYESRAAYLRSISWLTTPLSVVIAFCGLGIVTLALFIKDTE
jgi:hypothetical protein